MKKTTLFTSLLLAAVFALLTTALSSGVSQANPQQDITLTWDANTEADLAGYRIYASYLSGDYVKYSENQAENNMVLQVDLGPDIAPGNRVVQIAADGRKIFFVATAYDTSGNESGFSNEVNLVTDDLTPPDPVQEFQLVIQTTELSDGTKLLGFKLVPKR